METEKDKEQRVFHVYKEKKATNLLTFCIEALVEFIEKSSVLGRGTDKS